MAKKKEILIATRQIIGGKAKGDRKVVQAQEELTADRQKELGLTKDGVQSLIDSGALIAIPAHVATSEETDAELAAANKRADDAEAKVADQAKEIETLKTQVEAAKTAAAKAGGN